MPKNPLIAAILAVTCMIVLASLINVVGYQTIQLSNQKIIDYKGNQKELLFQTILDIANEKEIQKVILGSEITEKKFLNHGMRFSIFTTSILTEKFLKHAYTMGVILSITISKSKIHSMLEHYQVNNHGVQKKINAVIEKDAKLKNEITQLLNLKCDCDNNTAPWNFFILCLVLTPIAWFVAMVWALSHQMIFDNLIWVILDIWDILNC